MSDTPKPTAAEITCRRCARRVMVAQSAGSREVMYFDPEPGGLWRLNADGTATPLRPEEIEPGDAMRSEHRCARPSGPPAAPECSYCHRPVADHDPSTIGPEWLICRDGSGRPVQVRAYFRPAPLATCGQCGAGVYATHDLGGEG